MKIEINDAYESLISVFLAFVLVLNYFINVNLYNLELVAVVLMIAIALLFRTQIHIYKYNIYWMLAAVVPLISCFYSPYQRASFQYCMLLIFFIIFGICATQEGLKPEKIIHWLGCFTGFHVLVTLIQIAAPNVFYSFATYALKGDALTLNRNFFNGGTYCGLHDNPAMNGFYSAVFVICLFCRLLTDKDFKHNLWNIILVACGSLTMIFTQKRSFMVFGALVVATAWFIGAKRFQYKGRYIIITVIVAVVSLYLTFRYGIDKLATAKMLRYLQAGDVSNGRVSLWKSSLTFFYAKPILGVGIRTMSTLLGDDSHNMYIQLLAEVGIVGAVIFYVALLAPALYGIRVLLKSRDFRSAIFTTTMLQVLFLLYGIVANPLFDHRMMWIYGAIVGLHGGIALNEKNRGSDIS